MNKPQFCNPTEIAFLKSLTDSDLERVLETFPRHEQAAILRSLTEQGGSANERMMDRQREARHKGAEVYIPPVADPERRADCLADPVLFLRTYGHKTFTHPFAAHHLAMIHAIVERAKTGGDQAIAAPRGDGKTQVATWMMVYVLLAKLTRFPVVIASTRKHAQRIFRQVKHILGESEPLASDFPEISACVQELHGAPQRAAKQHVGGKRTGIIWTQEEIGLPDVDGSGYGGRYLTFFGLDSAIRGVHFNGVRPDFALIDDPETREAANSDEQNQNIEQMIDSDVAGLSGPDSQITRVVLTTIQNRRCYSFRVTDPKVKPSFAGMRFGVLSQWPERRDLWEEYVSMRQQNQQGGDKDANEATAWFLERQELMNAGAVVTNPARFNQKLDDEGNTVEVSALQAFFNRVADWGLPRVMAELQNDPEEEEVEESLNLTSGKVMVRVSGFAQNELPRIEGLKVTVGVDLGKYQSHWVKIVWHGNAIGHILDYGIIETSGVANATESKAVELALLAGLLDWRTDIIAENPPDFCLIDAGSGEHAPAVYEFVRRVGGSPFAASKGWDAGRFSMGKESPERRHFDQSWASYQPADQLWLYNVNTEHWKGWVHERFATPTFDELHHFNDGSLSLFAHEDRRRHLSFSKHIVAEERRELFVPGKGLQRKWVKVNKNNHWLDATALACAAAGCLGIRLVPRLETAALSAAASPRPACPQSPQGNRMNRPGGWIRGATNRTSFGGRR